MSSDIVLSDQNLESDDAHKFTSNIFVETPNRTLIQVWYNGEWRTAEILSSQGQYEILN